MPFLDEDKTEEILLVVGDSLRGNNRKWLLMFGIILIASIPGYLALKIIFFNVAASQYQPPKITGQVERSPLEELEKKFIKIGDSYSGYVKIKNPNFDWGVPKLLYRIEILDSAGILITSSTNESFVLPASEKYLVLPRFVASSAPSQINFSILESKFVLKPDSFPVLNIEVQRNSVAAGANETQLQAVLKNNSAFTISQVDLLATIYNDRGELVGMNYTNINDLLSGELRSFQLSWPYQIPGRLNAEISPEVNIYAKEIIKTQGPVSPFDP